MVGLMVGVMVGLMVGLMVGIMVGLMVGLNVSDYVWDAGQVAQSALTAAQAKYADEIARLKASQAQAQAQSDGEVARLKAEIKRLLASKPHMITSLPFFKMVPKVTR